MTASPVSGQDCHGRNQAMILPECFLATHHSRLTHSTTNLYPAPGAVCSICGAAGSTSIF